MSNISTASDDASEVVVAAASAADTWTAPSRRQPGWLTTRRQDHPYWIPHVKRKQSRRNYRCHRTSSARGPP